MPPRLTPWYSRFVSLMKVLLPVAALVLVALVALWPQIEDADEQFRIGFSTLKGADGVTDPSMVNARFVGTDKRNRPYSITADIAKRTSPDALNVSLEMPKADMTLKDGAWVILTADTGHYAHDAQTLDLSGNVTLIHDAGYTFTTDRARVSLDDKEARGSAPVHGHGGFGEIDGQGFVYDSENDVVRITGKSHLLLFPATARAGMARPVPDADDLAPKVEGAGGETGEAAQ